MRNEPADFASFAVAGASDLSLSRPLHFFPGLLHPRVDFSRVTSFRVFARTSVAVVARSSVALARSIAGSTGTGDNLRDAFLLLLSFTASVAEPAVVAFTIAVATLSGIVSHDNMRFIRPWLLGNFLAIGTGTGTGHMLFLLLLDRRLLNHILVLAGAKRGAFRC